MPAQHVQRPYAERRPARAAALKRLHTGLEIPRAALEAATLPAMLPWLGLAPAGDGHPVLLLPGFMAGESSLVALKRFLAARGHAVETWGFGRNVGFQSRHAAALEQKLRHMHHVHGRKVSLVGWSLGGLFSLYAAHRAPECVRSVITLGSPVKPGVGGSQAARSVLALYRVIAHPMGPDAHLLQPHVRKAIGNPPQLPISCLYSRSDGVVPVREAMLDSGCALHENIVVPGSHLGLGFNACVFWIVAERLAQAESGWRPFAPKGLAGAFYRAAARMP